MGYYGIVLFKKIMSRAFHLLFGRLTFEEQSALLILFLMALMAAVASLVYLIWYLLKFRSSVRWICVEGILQSVHFGVFGVRASYAYLHNGVCFYSTAVSMNKHRKYGAFPDTISRLRSFGGQEEKIHVFIDSNCPGVSFLEMKYDYWGVVMGIVIFALSIVVIIMYSLILAGGA